MKSKLPQMLPSILLLMSLVAKGASMNTIGDWNYGYMGSLADGHTKWDSEKQCIEYCLFYEEFEAIGVQTDFKNCFCIQTQSAVLTDETSKYILFNDLPANFSSLNISGFAFQLGDSGILTSKYRFPSEASNLIRIFFTDNLTDPKLMSPRFALSKVSIKSYKLYNKYPLVYYALQTSQTSPNEVMNAFEIGFKVLDTGLLNNSLHWAVQQISTPLVSEIYMVPFNVTRPIKNCQTNLRALGRGPLHFSRNRFELSLDGTLDPQCTADVEDLYVVIRHKDIRYVRIGNKPGGFGPTLVSSTEDNTTVYYEKFPISTKISIVLTYELDEDIMGERLVGTLLDAQYYVYIDGIKIKKQYLYEKVLKLKGVKKESSDSIVFPPSHNVASVISSLKIEAKQFFCESLNMNKSCWEVAHDNVTAFPSVLKTILAVNNVTGDIYGETNRGGKGVYDPNTKRFYLIPTSQWEEIKDDLIHAQLFSRDHLYMNETPQFTMNGIAHQCCVNSVCSCDVNYYGAYGLSSYKLLWQREKNCREKVAQTIAATLPSCSAVNRYCKQKSQGRFYINLRYTYCRSY